MPRPGTATSTGPAEQTKKVKMLKIVTFEKDAWGKLTERALYVFGDEDIARYERHKQQAAQAAEYVRSWLATPQADPQINTLEKDGSSSYGAFSHPQSGAGGRSTTATA